MIHRWPLAALKDLATITPGVSTTTRRETPSSRDAEYHVVSIGSLHDGGIAPRSTLACIRLGLSSAEKARAVLQAGDVLLSARGAALRISLVGHEHEGAVGSSTLHVIRSRGKVGGATLYAALRTPAGVQHLEQIARTSTATRAWRPSDVGAIMVPVPPARIQGMVEQLVETDHKYQAVALRALKLRQTTVSALLAEMLHGKQLSEDDYGF